MIPRGASEAQGREVRRGAHVLRGSAAAGIILLALLLPFSSCMKHKSVAYSPSPGLELRSDPSPVFSYQRDPERAGSLEVDGSLYRHYRLLGFSMPSWGDNGQEGNRVEASLFKSTLPGPRGLVIILPIWGNSNYPSRTLTSHILRASEGTVSVMQVKGERPLIDWAPMMSATTESEFLERWSRMAEHERTTVIDVLRVIDWARLQANIDPARIGVVGFSHSAMIAALASAQDPRLAATVLVMGGALPHAVLAKCCFDSTMALRRVAEERFGWTEEEYEARLRRVFAPLDPASYAKRVDPANVLVFDAERDRCIPPEAREALWEALGRPERVTFPWGHETSFMSMTPVGLDWTRRAIWEFLEKRLTGPSQPQHGAATPLIAAAPAGPVSPPVGVAGGRARDEAESQAEAARSGSAP